MTTKVCSRPQDLENLSCKYGLKFLRQIMESISISPIDQYYAKIAFNLTGKKSLSKVTWRFLVSILFQYGIAADERRDNIRNQTRTVMNNVRYVDIGVCVCVLLTSLFEPSPKF